MLSILLASPNYALIRTLCFIIVIAILIVAIFMVIAHRTKKAADAALKERENRKNIVFVDFDAWVDRVMDSCPVDDAEGYVFNIYDIGNKKYQVEIVATGSYYESIDDWTLDELWVSRHDFEDYLFTAESKEIAYEDLKNKINKYINNPNAKHYRVFQTANAVAMGFIDDNYEVIYKN